MKVTSVRIRLTLWNIGILTLVLFGFLLVTQYAVHEYLLGNIDRRLKDMTERQVWLINRITTEETSELSDANRPRRLNSRSFRFTRMFDMNSHPLVLAGLPVTSTENPWDVNGYLHGVAGKTMISTIEEHGSHLRVLSRPLIIQDRQIGVIQVSAVYDDVQALLKSLAETLLLLVPCALAVAGIGGLVLTSSVMRPVRQIIKAADALHHEDMSQRLPVVGGDEFAHLATTMNSMLTGLEGAFTQLRQSIEKERRFTADASHELRTPLTVIKANASLALRGNRTPEQYREGLQAINQAAEMMHRLVQDLLLLARSDSGQLTMDCQPVNPRALFTTAIAMARHDDQHAPVLVEVAPTTGLLLGDEHHLQRVFVNLLENALRHTPPDGAITLAAVAVQEQVVITITDNGEGIAPEHLPHLGERFYRIDAARARQHGGTGLGISISKSIVEAHQGTLVIDSTVGEGTRVTITLPRAMID